MGAGARWPVVTIIGVTQIFAWGSSYYLPAVLAPAIAADTGWSLTAVVAGLSIGLLIAGLVSPRIGRLIGERGGRLVLAASPVLLGAGQIALAAAYSFPVYVGAWIVLGLGMGAGLYDPAFATLGRMYGQGARSAITSVTLFGGFASTVCWPLTAYLEAHLGWRGTCLVYAAVQIGVALPLYLLGLPRPLKPSVASAPDRAAEAAAPAREPGQGLFILLALVITLSSVVSTTLSVHLLTVLQTRGVGPAEAVGLGMLVGPAQVVARSAEMAIARYHHAIWTKLASTALVALGVGALVLGGAVVPIALVLYGAGIGVESIARGTVPLAIYGPERYPAIMGRIALPSLVAQAATPPAAAVLLQWGGASAFLWFILAVGIGNLLLSIGLFMRLRGMLDGCVARGRACADLRSRKGAP